MIEILFVYMLGKRMGEMLQRKGYENPLRYQMLVPIWWFTGEIAGAFACMFIRARVTGANELTMDLSIYPGALIGALLAVTGLLMIVRQFPNRPSNLQPAPSPPE